MSYIGKSPSFGSYSMLDNLTASATASYSLTLDSTAFVPESANHLIVSLNGVIQKAGSSFTVAGSTLTFSSALTSSDSIDFILALGNVLDIGTPSDSTVTNAKTNFVSTSSAAGLQIKGDGTTDGTLQLNCSQNSHGIKLKSPNHASSSSYTLTFPATDPSADKFLKTDGSGNLSFADAGGILQVVSTSKTDTFTTSSNSFVDITGFTVSITPSSTSSKVFIIANLNCSGTAGVTAQYFRIVRDSTDILKGDASSSRGRVTTANITPDNNVSLSSSMSFLDSPSSTSALTYKIQTASSASGTVYVNRTPDDADSFTKARGASTLTVFEVSA